MALVQAEVDLSNQSLGKIGATRFTLANQATAITGIQANLHFDQTRDTLLRSFEWPFAKTRLRLVSAWLTDTVYSTDQYVWQDALLYKCNTAHTSDVFLTDIANWTLISTVDDWVTATAYTVGETVVNNAVLFKCILAHTSGDTDDEPGVGAITATYWVVSTNKPVNVFGFSYDMPENSLRLARVNDDINHISRRTHHHHHDHRFPDWRLETNTILTDLTEVDIVYIDKVDTTTEWDALFTELFICKLALKLLNPLAGAGSGGLNLRQILLKEVSLLNKQTRRIGRQEGNRSGNSSWVAARLTSRFHGHTRHI